MIGDPLDLLLSDAQLKLRNGYDDYLARAVADARDLIQELQISLQVLRKQNHRIIAEREQLKQQVEDVKDSRELMIKQTLDVQRRAENAELALKQLRKWRALALNVLTDDQLDFKPKEGETLRQRLARCT